MLRRTDAFTVDGVRLFRDSEAPELFYAAPVCLELASNSTGSPLVSLMYLGNRANLTVETTWGFDMTRREALTAAIVARLGTEAPPAGDIRVLPVPIDQGEAELVVRNSGDDEKVLIRAQVSSFGQQRTTLSALLPAADAQLFEGALRRPAGEVEVRYVVRAIAFATLRVEWVADVACVTRELQAANADPADADAILAQLGQLVATGAVVVTEVPDGNVASPQTNALSRELAELLATNLVTNQGSSVRLAREASFTEPLVFRPFCSVSEALAGVPIERFVIGTRP